MLELARRSSRLREDGSAVTVAVGVGQFDGLVEGVGFQHYENRTKDLFPEVGKKVK